MHPGIQQLREQTAELHERIETLGYARAVLDGSLPLAHYTSFLRAVALVHEALAELLERHSRSPLHARLDELAGPGLARRALLERDLAHLGCDLHTSDAAALSALLLGQRLRQLSERDLSHLLGTLYVLEGSQLGGVVQSAALASRPELAQAGRSYLTGAGKTARTEFQQFLAALSPLLVEPAALAAAVRGAQVTFEGFEAILSSLAPDEPPLRAHVTQLNVEAGSHALPADLREIEAALRAGEQSYRRFAYYEARYGDRGLRYTRSDSAWLSALGREHPAQALAQVDWLARVLAARGMPRLLLELHLTLLHECLVVRVPERREQYCYLREAARALQEERMRHMPSTPVSSGASEPPAELGVSAREAATLVLAAVADERCGVEGPVPSLMGWLCDPTRFSPTWCARLESLLDEARAAPHVAHDRPSEP